MPCQCGYPDGMSPREETLHQDTHTGMAYLFYHIEYKPQFGKISMKTTMTAGRSALVPWKRASATMSRSQMRGGGGGGGGGGGVR